MIWRRWFDTGPRVSIVKRLASQHVGEEDEMSVEARLERLRRSLTPDFNGAIIARPIHIHYLTGWQPPARWPSYLVVGPTRALLLAPDLANECDPAVEVMVYDPYSHQTPVDPGTAVHAALLTGMTIAGCIGQSVALEEEWLPVDVAGIVAGRAQTGRLGDRLDRQRRVKDAQELSAIRRAAGITDGALAAVQQHLQAGRTELEVYAEAVRAILIGHGAPFTMESVFLSGPRTMAVVGPPTDRRLAPGDLVIFDVFPYLGGYKVDLTRTYSVGPAGDEPRRLHDLLHQALRAGEEMLRPGVTGGQVDAATRGIIAAAGHNTHVSHHMGHAIGLFHPERPSIVPHETIGLAPGMVITLEPGVYVPGVGGLRLEQNYIIQDGPPEPLSQFPLELIETPA